MDIENLIKQYRQAADKWEKRHPVTDTFDLRVQDVLRDAAVALSTLQAENEKLRETVDKYATAARAIALNFKPFCDESLPYDEMIADAARKASDELEQVKRERDAAIKTIFQWTGCPECKWWDSADDWCEKHDRAADCCGECCSPEWRGPQKED